jgi:hypothetical protein
MTRGIVIFAQDTETRAYTRMAAYAAERITRYLNLPVTLITDSDVSDACFDQVINITQSKTQRRQIGNTGVNETWKNFGRYRAYELSPYDETILLDADYICGSDQLLKLFDLNQPFMCHKRRIYLGTQVLSHQTEKFGNNADMWWATVVYFKRSPEAQSIFTMMQMIQENYDHYAKIYRFKTQPYRNDYAISIAINTVYGHIQSHDAEIPWPLYNVEFTTEIAVRNDSDWQLEFNRHVNGELKRFKISTHAQDLHMLNKDSLFGVIG